MNGDWTGFEPDKIVNKLNQIQNAYESLLQALHGKTQNEFINQMAEEWACREAQEFFTGTFKPTMDQQLKGSYDTFQNVVEVLNQEAQRWATLNKADWSTVSFNGELKDVTVDNIQENIGGIRGIREQAANETAEVLPKIEADVNSAVADAESAVHDCGFLDPSGNMESSLINSLNAIKNDFEEAMSQIREAFKSYVNKTVENYAETSRTTSDLFTRQ